MLVLSRKPGEEIAIIDQAGQTVASFKVGEIRRDKVRLHFNAPQSTRIMRTELLAAATMPVSTDGGAKA